MEDEGRRPQQSMAERHDILSKPMSRRTLLRNGAIGLGVAMFTPNLVACGRSGSATTRSGTGRLSTNAGEALFGQGGAPGGRHLSFGPDPTTQMRVAWQVASPVRDPFIRIGPTGGDLGRPIPAQLRSLPTRVFEVISMQHYVHAELDGLSPGTDYVYAIGHRGFSDADWLKSALSTFRTAPGAAHSAAPFTFTAFGDQGNSSSAATGTALVGAQQPAFHLLAGDISYADGTGRGDPPATTEDPTHDIFDPMQWDRYFTQIDRVACSVPWMVAAGNHEMEAAYSADGYGGLDQRFLFPHNGPRACPAVYSFVYGNVGVISLDANDLSFEIRANLGYSGGTQTPWLRETLRSLRDNKRVDFIVVFFHHCAYCTGKSHGSEGGVRNLWVPLFDEYQVDLVINGHNHIYERTDPLRGGTVSSPAPPGSTVRPDTDGTTYITAGGGGRTVESFAADQSYAGHESPVDEIRSQVWNDVQSLGHQQVGWSRVRYAGFSLVAVEVKPGSPGQLSRMTVKALAQNGGEVDRVELQRVAGRRSS